jgi:hypothetical protein
MKLVFSEHALFEMEFRKIDKEEVERLIEHPMQKLPARKNRIIMQKRYTDDMEHKEMLLRVIGEELENTFHVITVYKTSKIEKYWKKIK